MHKSREEWMADDAKSADRQLAKAKQIRADVDPHDQAAVDTAEAEVNYWQEQLNDRKHKHAQHVEATLKMGNP
jgi:hypothetical protein